MFNKNDLGKLSGTALVAVTTCLVVACGGGGGGSTTVAGAQVTPPVTQPVTPTCANGAPDYPTCTPTVVPAQLQLIVPAPPYAAGSEDLNAFNYYNDIRKSLGLGLVAYSKELEQSAINHMNYQQINKVGGFDEDPTKPGFTGRTTNDRAAFAGYNTNQFVSGGLSVALTKSGGIQGLMNTIYHRSVLIRQDWLDVGSGKYTDVTNLIVFNILVSKKTSGQRNASDFTMVYPRDGQTNVDLTMGGETINPFPEYPDGNIYGKVGYPVTFAVEASQTLALKSFTMTEKGQTTPLDAVVYTLGNDPNKFIGKNEAYLTAKAQLKASTTYNLSFSGTANGKDVAKIWSFTTAPSRLPMF